MKHLKYFFLMLAVVLAFSVSCRADVEETKVVELAPVDVVMDIVEEKSLESSHDRQVECFVVSSRIISATQKDFPVVGEFENLKVQRGSGAYPATPVALGKHTQGLWKFHVQAITKDGDIMYYGSAQKYISEGSAVNGVTNVSVALVPYLEGSGTLSINYFRSMAISDPRLVVQYQTLNSNTWVTLLDSKGPEAGNFSSHDEQNGYMTYTASGMSLLTGAYKVKVILYNGSEIFSGEMLDIYIHKGKNTNLAGEFTVSGMASYIPIDPGQKIKFTEAAEKIGIPEGQILKGFYVLGGDSTTSVDFNPYYTNNTSSIVYLMPMFDSQDTYFLSSTSGTAVTITGKASASSLKYVAFSSTYLSSPTIIGEDTFLDADLRALYAPTVSSVLNSSFCEARNFSDYVFAPLVMIGRNAFEGCESLTECPAFGPSVSIGSHAFVSSAIASVEIPSTVVGGRLDSFVFAYCTNLRTAKIAVKEIGTSAFLGCSALTYAELENTEIIGTNAFKDCSLLQTPVIPESVYQIGTNAFYGCSSMTGTIDISQAIGTGFASGTRENAVVNTTPIEANAFSGTNISDIYIARMYGDIDVSSIGAPAGCTITYWGYYLYFDANNPEDNTPRIPTYNPITSRNGTSLAVSLPENVMDANGVSIKAITTGTPPVFTYVYTADNSAVSTNNQNHPRVQRIVGYNIQLGKTRDGYPLPIPTREGFAFTGWYTSPDNSQGTRYNEFTNYETRGNLTLYAHWQEGVTTVIFNNGSNDDGQAGNCSETYRTVRYLENYGRRAAEDPEQDQMIDLPDATVPGRVFLGWYFEEEPKMSNNYPDEVDQANKKEVISSNSASASVSKNLWELNYATIATSGNGSLPAGYNRQTQWKVETNEGHILYAHYLDNRYGVIYNPQYPTGATKETASSYTTVNGSHVVTGMTFPTLYVKNGYNLGTSWDPTRLATDNAGIAYSGTSISFPDMNTSDWSLDNYYFKGWYYNGALTSARANTSDEVPKKVYGTDTDLEYGDTIDLYAKWIGKEVRVEFYYDTAEPQLLRGGTVPTRVEDGEKIENPESVDTGTSVSYQPATAAGDVRKFNSYYYTRTTSPHYATTMATRVDESAPDNEGNDTVTAFPTTVNAPGYNYLDASGNIDTAAHWFSEPECINEVLATDVVNTMKYSYSGNSLSENTIRLYTKLAPKTVTVTFNVNANDASVPTSSKTVTYTGTYGTLPVPTRTGYKFVGWYESTARSNGYGYSQARVTNESTVLTYENHTLYAAWVSYEYALIEEDTDDSVDRSIYDDMSGSTHRYRSTYSYSGRVATYTITPTESDGKYRRWNGNTYTLTGNIDDIKDDAVCFYYEAHQVPTTESRSSSSTLTYTRNTTTGAWTMSGWLQSYSKDYVSYASIDYTVTYSGTNRGTVQDPHIANNSTAWANKTASQNYRSVIVQSESDRADNFYKIYITPEKPGSCTIDIFDDDYYGNKALPNAANPFNPDAGNSSARITKISFTCYGDLDNSGLSSMLPNITSLKVQDTDNTYGITFSPTTVHESQRNITWSIHSKPTGDNESALRASASPYSIILDVGYKTGTIVLRCTSEFNTGIYIDKSITINPPCDGAVSIGSGETARKFTSVVIASIKGEGGSSLRLIPTGKVVTGFYVYGSGSSTTVSFPYSQSTGHDVWLIPIDESATNTAIGDFTAPTGKEYLAYPANVVQISTTNMGSSLKAVYLPKSVTTINSGMSSSGAFNGCQNLSDFYVEDNNGSYNLATIGAYVFYNCKKLEFPNAAVASVTTLGNYAFYGCTKLTGTLTFTNCSLGNYALKGTKISSLILNGSCTVGTQLCYDVTTLTTLALGGTTSLGSQAFYSTCLGSVAIPSTVTTMGNGVFKNTNVTSCSIGCTTLGDSAFYDCTSLTTITFQSTARTIGSNAFSDCTSLVGSQITWGGVTTIGDYAFNSANISGSLTITNVVTIGEYAFAYCGGMTTLTIPNTTTKIKEGAFYSCPDIDRLYLGTGLTGTTSNPAIESEAFSRCTDLVSVEFGQTSAFVLGESVFRDCSDLYEIDVLACGNNFKNCTIGDDTWTGCSIERVKLTQGNFSSYLRCYHMTGKSWLTIRCGGGFAFAWMHANNTQRLEMGFGSVNDYDSEEYELAYTFYSSAKKKFADVSNDSSTYMLTGYTLSNQNKDRNNNNGLIGAWTYDYGDDRMPGSDPYTSIDNVFGNDGYNFCHTCGAVIRNDTNCELWVVALGMGHPDFYYRYIERGEYCGYHFTTNGRVGSEYIQGSDASNLGTDFENWDEEEYVNDCLYPNKKLTDSTLTESMLKTCINSGASSAQKNAYNTASGHVYGSYLDFMIPVYSSRLYNDWD